MSDLVLEIGAAVDGALSGIAQIEKKFQALQVKAQKIKFGVKSGAISDLNTVDSKLKSVLNTLQAISTISIPKISFGGVAPKVTVRADIDRDDLGKQITSAAQSAPKANIKIKAEVTPEVKTGSGSSRGVKKAAEDISNAFKLETIEVDPTFVVDPKEVSSFKSRASKAIGQIEIEVSPVLAKDFQGSELAAAIRKAVGVVAIDVKPEFNGSIDLTDVKASIAKITEVNPIIKFKPSFLGSVQSFGTSARSFARKATDGVSTSIKLTPNTEGFASESKAVLGGIELPSVDISLTPNLSGFASDVNASLRSVVLDSKSVVISAEASNFASEAIRLIESVVLPTKEVELNPVLGTFASKATSLVGSLAIEPKDVEIRPVASNFKAEVDSIVNAAKTVSKRVLLTPSAEGFAAKANQLIDSVELEAFVTLRPKSDGFGSEAKKIVSGFGSQITGDVIEGPTIFPKGLSGLQEVTEELNKIANLAAKDYTINVKLSQPLPEATIKVGGDFTVYQNALKKITRSPMPFDYTDMQMGKDMIESLTASIYELITAKQGLRGRVGLGVTAPGLENKVKLIERLQKVLEGIPDQSNKDIRATFQVDAGEFPDLRDELYDLTDNVQVIKIRFEDIGGGLPPMPVGPTSPKSPTGPGGAGGAVSKADIMNAMVEIGKATVESTISSSQQLILDRIKKPLGKDGFNKEGLVQVIEALGGTASISQTRGELEKVASELVKTSGKFDSVFEGLKDLRAQYQPLRGGDAAGIEKNARENLSMRKILSSMAETTTSYSRAMYMLEGLNPQAITTDLAGLASTQRRLYESNPELREFTMSMGRFDALLREIAQRFAAQRRAEQPPRVFPLRSSRNELPEDVFNRARIEAATKKIQFWELRKLSRPALPPAIDPSTNTTSGRSVVNSTANTVSTASAKLASLLSSEIEGSVKKGFMNTDLRFLGNTLQEFLSKEAQRLAQRNQQVSGAANQPRILAADGSIYDRDVAIRRAQDRADRSARTLDFIANDTKKKLGPQIRGIFDAGPRQNTAGFTPVGSFSLGTLPDEAKSTSNVFKRLGDAISAFGKRASQSIDNLIKSAKSFAASPPSSASGGGSQGVGGGGGFGTPPPPPPPYTGPTGASGSGGGFGGGFGGGGFTPFGGIGNSGRFRRFQDFGSLDEFNERLQDAIARSRETSLFTASRLSGQGNQADEIQITANARQAFMDLARESLLAAEAQKVYRAAVEASSNELRQTISRSRVGTDIVDGPIERGFFNRSRVPGQPQGNRSFQSDVVRKRQARLRVERAREVSRINELIEANQFSEAERLLDADIGNRRDRGPMEELTQGQRRQRTSNRPRERDRGQRFLRQKISSARADRRGEIISEGLIGGGFPLLFGAGPGSALGGLIGGVGGGLLKSGGGFAGSLIASYLGAQVDLMVTNLTTLADAMKSPTQALAALETSGFRVSGTLKSQVQELVSAGKAYEAQTLVFSEIERRLGSGSVQSLNALNREQIRLQEQWSELSGSLQRELIPAMIAVTRAINDVIGAAKFLGSIKIGETEVVKDLGGKVAGSNSSVFAAQTAFSVAQFFGKQITRGAAGSTPELSEADRVANVRAAFDRQVREAGDVKDAYRQAFQFQRDIYDLEQSAVDLRRELIDLERSWADELFNRRRESAQAELETARLAAELRAGQVTNSFTAQGIGGDSEEARLLDAVGAYINARARGEQELQAKQKEAELRIAEINKQTADFQFKTAREVEDIERKKLSYVRSVEDYKMKVADYQYEIALKIAQLNMQAMAEGGGSDPAGQVGDTVNQIANALMSRLNLTMEQAAGVIGNLQRESGLNPRVNEGGSVGLPAGRGGYGIAQWTGSRQTDLIRFAGGREAAGSLEKQIDFLVYELKVKESRALASLRAARSPEQAAYVFNRDFERSRIKALPERKANARAAYNQLMGDSSMSMGSGVIGITGGRRGSPNAGRSTGPHTDIRWADGRPISAADAGRFIAVDGVPINNRRFPVTSGYGPRSAPVPGASDFHRGIDFGTPEGLPITLRNGASFAGSIPASESDGGGLTGIINTPMGQMKILHLEKVMGRSVTPMTGVGRQLADAAMPVKPEFSTTPIGPTPDAARANADYIAASAEITNQLKSQLALYGDIYKLGNETARLELRKQIVGNTNTAELDEQLSKIKEQKRFLMENIAIGDKGLEDKFAQIDAEAEINAIIDQRNKLFKQIDANTKATSAEKADVKRALGGFFDERIANVRGARRKREEIRTGERQVKEADEIRQAILQQQNQNRELEATIAAQATILGQLTEQEKVRLSLIANQRDINSEAAKTLLSEAAKTDELKKQLEFAQKLKGFRDDEAFAGSGIKRGFTGRRADAFEDALRSGLDEENALKLADAAQKAELAAVTYGNLGNVVEDVSNRISTGLVSGLGSVLSGVERFEDVAKNLLADIATSLVRYIEEMIATTLRDALGETLGSILGDNKIMSPSEALKDAATQQSAANLTVFGATLNAATQSVATFAASLEGSKAGNMFGIKNLFGDVSGGSVDNLFSASGSLGTDLFSEGSIITDLFSGALSFDGGGFTGYGARAGGIDGKGGFTAVLHPNETVIDHTRINERAPSIVESEEREMTKTSQKLWETLNRADSQKAEEFNAGNNVSMSYDGPTLIFDSKQYVLADDVPRIISRAVKESYGYQRQRIQNHPAERRAMGMR